MGRGVFLWNRLAKRYSLLPIADQASYERKLEITRKYFTPESEVLEIGCGTGSTALLHAPYVKHIHAIDYAGNMIDIANDKLKKEKITNVTFAVDEIENLASQKQQYDVVLALNIIHLLEDKETALRNIHSLLKPGGYFISSTACLERVPWIVHVLLKVVGLLGLAPRLKPFSEQQLLDSVNTAGFTKVEQWNPDSKMTVVFLVAQKPKG